MSDKIVEAVAKAIYEEMDLSDSLALPEATRYARAAIEAYEAEKRGAEAMSETVITDELGREFTVRWPKSQEVKVMGIDFVAWDVQP